MSGGRSLNIEGLWPRPLRRLGKDFLRSIDAESFALICRLVARRARKRSGSRKHARHLVQELIRRRHPYPHGRHERVVLSARFRSSALLSALCPDREQVWQDPRRRSRREEFQLTRFSFIDDPAATFSALCEFARAEARCVEARVHFDDAHMLDIGPYLVWGLMRQDMAPVLSGGRISEGVRQAVDATGLREFMRISPRRNHHDGRIAPFPLRRKHGGQLGDAANLAFRPSSKEKVSTDLVETVDGWLHAAGVQLTSHGTQQLASLCAEILDNAERHARPEGGGEWAVAGLMERRAAVRGAVDQRETLVCNLAFVNVGLSIGETICNTEDPIVAADLDEYLAQHGCARLVGDLAKARLLATVLAAQDGVSRFRQDQGARGGVGIMTAVEAVQSLGEEIGDGLGPALTVISGRACIQFAPPYLRFAEKDSVRLQWFNSDSRPEDPPDPTHVFNLPAAFPGTIITARFVLREEAVAVASATKDDNDNRPL